MNDAQSADKKKPGEFWIDKAHELAALKPDLLEKTLDAMEPNAAASFREYLERKSGDPAIAELPR
ncbi:hypothetical protein [Asaia spathodeae]|uniref:Uncharacterized protein n=1 Tax=Asaia spathodeae TaxID=657016 RepID=A0ABX2PAK9_9PROT|nr:hypothetical protein [Asaia spathodeae]GBR16804.1 hypothetical protein AA105894_1662 [Asaia spathodeae NBRC 105894]